MGKKRIIIIAIIILLFIGLGTFVFANPQEDLEGNGNNNSNQVNNTINGSGDDPVILDNPNKEDEPSVPVISQPGQFSTQNAYNAALAALQRAENTLDIIDAQKAESLINALVASNNKSALELRLENVLNTIDLYSLVERAVSLLNSSSSYEDVSSLRTYMSSNNIVSRVANLIYTEVKDALESDIDKVNRVISDQTTPVITGYGDGYLKDTKALAITDETNYKLYLNDEEVELSTLNNITEDGIYAIKVVDEAFNETNLVIRIDNSNPVIDITDGAQYKTGFIPSITDSSLKSVTINDQAYALGSAINDPGYYHMVATDMLGNSSEVMFIIGKVPTRVEVVVPSDLVYDGTNKKIESYKIYNEYTGEEVNATVSVVYQDNINAGTSDVTVTYAGDNYYEESTVTAQMQIAKADVTINLTAPDSLVYSTKVKEYKADVVDNSGNVIDEASVIYYDTLGNIVTATEVGNYEVVASYNGNNNYNAAPTVRTQFTIEKARTRINLVAPENLVYNGQDKVYTAVVEAEYDGVWTEVTKQNAVYDDVNGKRISNIRNAGNYTVKGYYPGNSNLKASYKEQKVTIAKAETEIRFAEDSFTYDGIEKVVTPTIYIKGTRTVAFGSSALSEFAYTGDRINAGSFTVNASYAGNLNYLPCDITKEFTINPLESAPTNESSFNDLYKNADSNNTLKLENDLVISGITNKKNAGKTVIDLNGHTLTFTDPDKYLIVRSNQEIIFKNGNLNLVSPLANYETISVTSGGKLTFDNINANVEGTAILAKGISEVNIVNSNISATGYVISTNASKSANFYPTINVNSSNLTSTAATAVLFNVPGNLNIMSSNVYGHFQGVFLRGGNAIIANSTITNTNTDSSLLNSYIDSNWESGSYAPVTALLLGNRSNSYKYPTNVTLTNTRLVSSLYPSMYVYANSEEGNGVYISGSYDETNTIYASNNIFINDSEYQFNN